MKELFRLEIPNYITHVMLSKSRPANYYTRHSRIPYRYRSDDYTFNNYGVLIEIKTGEPVIANPLTAGKPRLKKINGREFLSGELSHTVRTLIMREMRRFYWPYFQKKKRITQACKVKLEIHNTIGAGNQDLDNMSVLMVKVIQDILVESNVLPEDNIQVIKGFEVDFVPTNSLQQRKLVVIILALEQQAKMATV